MSKLSGAILDLVRGLPSLRRERWRIMALQAFIDDSVGSGTVLVMAGYVSSAEKWSAFSDEWQQILSMSPRMRQFKMNAFNLSSDIQFERLRHFHRVIEDNVLFSAAVAIDMAALTRLVEEMKMPTFLANPYHIGHKAIINFVAQVQVEHGSDEKVDFIFDKRGEAEAVRQGFASYSRTVPPDVLAVTGSEPIFRDDEDFLPLQAADFLAWWVRKHYLEHHTVTETMLQLPWKVSRTMPALWLTLNETELRRELSLMKKPFGLDTVARTTPVKVSFSFDRS